MKLYDVTGKSLTASFDNCGNVPSCMYDVEGNIVSHNMVPIERKLTVMSYNVQYWNTTYMNTADNLENMLEGSDVDILGVQEHHPTRYDNSENCVNLLLEKFDNVIKSDPLHSNGMGMLVASRYDISNATTTYYDSCAYTGTYEYTDTEGEKQSMPIKGRAYQKMYINYYGVDIAVFNTHLEYTSLGAVKTKHGLEYRRRQSKELFDAAQKEIKNGKSVIIIGDLNVLETDISTDKNNDYNFIMKRFVDAGYNCANAYIDESGKGVFHDTCFEYNDVYDENGIIQAGEKRFESFPTDNIITSPNIKINSVSVDFSKADVNSPDELDKYKTYDHFPIIAKLTVYAPRNTYEDYLDKQNKQILNKDGNTIVLQSEEA